MLFIKSILLYIADPILTAVDCYCTSSYSDLLMLLSIGHVFLAQVIDIHFVLESRCHYFSC